MIILFPPREDPLFINTPKKYQKTNLTYSTNLTYLFIIQWVIKSIIAVFFQ